MEKKERVKNLIHLAIKAGKIKFGVDNFVFLIRKKGRVKLVILDKSLSEGNKRKVIRLAEENNLRYFYYPGNMDEEIKFGVKLISVLDTNFARPISELLL